VLGDRDDHFLLHIVHLAQINRGANVLEVFLSRGCTRLPTSVVERKSSTAWLHLASARSRILNRFRFKSFYLLT
jgi:hypothetical protein